MPRAILIVDDSAVVRAAVRRHLRAHGFQVTEVGSLAEARAIDPTTLAAALLDMELGDGSGPDVAAHLRLAAPSLPIAFLTGGGDRSVLEAASTFGPVFSKMGPLDEAIRWLSAQR